MTPDQTMTADAVHAAVHDLRARAETPPEKIELGQAQLAAIEADVRAAAGTDDIGPLTQFQGLPIVRSRKQDHVRLLRAGEKGEDEAVPEVAIVAPSGPEAEAVESAG